MDIFGAVLAYLHFGAMALLAAMIAMELLYLRLGPNAKIIAAMWRVDIFYIGAGILALLSGALRLGFSPKGVMFYVGNTLFWIKLILVGALALASFLNSQRYASWLHLARTDSTFHPPASEVSLATLLVKIQIALLISIPIFAVLMVHGIRI
ncbi:MAG: DUF2214 family protein [Burkholderiales bacterium]